MTSNDGAHSLQRTPMYLIDRLRHFAAASPSTAALCFEDETISYHDLWSRVGRCQTALTDEFGVRRGDRVAYLGLNHPDMLTLLFACAGMGAIFNPLNSRLVAEEYLALLADGEPTVCLYDAGFATMVDQLFAAGCRFAPLTEIHAAAAKPADPGADPLVDHHDPLLLVYTSGTTGRSKGVILSHEAVEANIDNCHAHFGFGEASRVQVTIPLFHVGGLCILLLPALAHGATVFLSSRFDPAAALEQVEAESVTVTIWVPAQMAVMMEMPQWSQTDLSSLDCVVVGSSRVPLSHIRNLHARSIPASQIYGATETGPAALGLAIDDALSHEGSAGTPVKGVQVQIRDTDRNEVPSGDRGEIWVRGANILTGYWRDEAETAKVLVDGWYNTGDIGYVDPEGFYWVVDRSKDLIISGGENIYPAEVEAACSQHPAVTSVAVVGREDQRWGETPVAAVELADGEQLTLAELGRFLADKVARYKHPTDLVVFGELPRNAMGKIDKPALRNRIAGQHQR